MAWTWGRSTALWGRGQILGGLLGAWYVRDMGTSMLTIRGVLLHDLHGSRNAGFFAVGVVEEGQVALPHRPQVVSGHVVANPWELSDMAFL
jgi:hypothetical protein